MWYNKNICAKQGRHDANTSGGLRTRCEGARPMSDSTTTVLPIQLPAKSSDLLNKQARRAEPYYWNDTIETAAGNAFNWLCPFCGADLNETGYHKTHISPVGTGIGFVPGNIVLACPSCNQDMHTRHAWTWCFKKGISFWGIQLTLEVLARIFPSPENIRQPKSALVKRPDASRRVTEYLSSHPEALEMNPLELAAMLQVGKSTVYNVLKQFKNGQEG